jgi:hypothetical protein
VNPPGYIPLEELMNIKEYVEKQEASSEVTGEAHKKAREIVAAAEEHPAVIKFREAQKELKGILSKFFKDKEVKSFQVFTGNGFVAVTVESWSNIGEGGYRERSYHVSLEALNKTPEEVRSHDLGRDLRIMEATSTHSKLSTQLENLTKLLRATEASSPMHSHLCKARDALDPSVTEAKRILESLKKEPKEHPYIWEND